MGVENVCYCPFAKAHCESGVVEKGTNLVCEFWNGTDCRIRLVLELMENKLKKEKTDAV